MKRAFNVDVLLRGRFPDTMSNLSQAFPITADTYFCFFPPCAFLKVQVRSYDLGSPEGNALFRSTFACEKHVQTQFQIWCGMTPKGQIPALLCFDQGQISRSRYLLACAFNNQSSGSRSESIGDQDPARKSQIFLSEWIARAIGAIGCISYKFDQGWGSCPRYLLALQFMIGEGHTCRELTSEQDVARSIRASKCAWVGNKTCAWGSGWSRLSFLFAQALLFGLRILRAGPRISKRRSMRSKCDFYRKKCRLDLRSIEVGFCRGWIDEGGKLCSYREVLKTQIDRTLQERRTSRDICSLGITTMLAAIFQNVENVRVRDFF